MFALLPVHKPRGFNSRRIVDAVAIASGDKVGHAGTLDPLASGVLLTAIGPATRLVPYAQRLAKRYTARFQLGLESDSDDTERECRPVTVSSIPSRDEVANAVATFVGSIDQTPPPFSAVRIDGRRAYRLAHRGREFTIPSRQVTIFTSRLIRYEFPIFEVEVCCGSGTYIRSLGRDIAALLGTKCVLLELCRDAVGSFVLSRCATFEDIQLGTIHDKLINPLEIFSGLPIIALGEYDLERIARGIKYECEMSSSATEMLVTDLDCHLHAVMRPASDGKWRPALNFSKYWRGGHAHLVRSAT